MKFIEKNKYKLVRPLVTSCGTFQKATEFIYLGIDKKDTYGFYGTFVLSNPIFKVEPFSIPFEYLEAASDSERENSEESLCQQFEIFHDENTSVLFQNCEIILRHTSKKHLLKAARNLRLFLKGIFVIERLNY